MAKKVDIKQISRVARDVKDVAEFVKPFVDKYGPKAVDAAKKGGVAIVVNAKKVKTDIDGAANNIRIHRGRTGAGRKLKDERLQMIKESSAQIDAREFKDTYESCMNNAEGRYWQSPGCFAILTMPNALVKDPARYQDVYAGCSDNVGAEIYKNLIGRGNVDVYADMKNKKKMTVLVYAYAQDVLLQQRSRLIDELQAYDSYNAGELENE
jgi:hypothetical protein